MQNQALRTGQNQVITADPVWLRSVKTASRPVRFTSGGILGRMKRWVRRVVAKAAWRGSSELFADQQALNLAMIEALKGLTAEVQVLQAHQRKSMRHSKGSATFLEELRAIREDIRLLQRREIGDSPIDSLPLQEVGLSNLETLYRALEETFRGSEELIESRLEVYRPWVLKSLAGLSDPVWLDLGCGRGEWLRLLAYPQSP